MPQSLRTGLITFVVLCLAGTLQGQDDWSSALRDYERSADPLLPATNTGQGTPRQEKAVNKQGSDWNIEEVMRQLDRESQSESTRPDDPNKDWWTPFVTEQVDSAAQAVNVNVGDLMVMALEYSAKVSVARALPRIRETAITGAEAEFDWKQFIDSKWVDTSEPVGSALTVGGNGTRFREHNFSIDAGLRRKFFNGADFYTYQRTGHVNSNSSFFIPNDQATSKIVLGYTQPLLRGRGAVYNTSLIVLAEIDTGSATDEFHRQLQSHLLEVARGYWALYLERTNLAQKVSLYLKTKSIAEQLKSRAAIDAQQTQVISANAALESRKSDLVRSRAAVKNAETRLRSLINAPMLSGAPDMLEMIPIEHPTTLAYPAETSAEFEIALQNRPEIAAAMKAIRASCVRLQMSENEILPSLNLVTEAYVSGLRGQSDIGNAWVDQFREGEPSYSVGIQYEVPLGRRAARSNLQRRQVEVRQLEDQYRATLELVRADVEVAVRELKTAFLELDAKNRSRIAAVAEAATMKARWEELGDHLGTGALLLESLLRAQERVTQAEYEYAMNQMTYSLALINLRHANGTLFQLFGNTDAMPNGMSNGYSQPSPNWHPTQPQPAPSQPAPAKPARPPKPDIAQRRHPLHQIQQANLNWNRPANFNGIWEAPEPLQNHPLMTGEATGLTYGEMIGRPAASEANRPEDTRRKKLR